MSIQFRCANPRRAQVLSTAPVAINGIDFLEVLDHDAPAGAPPQRTLLVHMIKDAPFGLSAANVRIEGGVRITGVQVAWAIRAADASPADVVAGRMTAAERTFYNALPAADRVLVVRTDQDGDFSTYTLRLVRSTTDAQPPVGFDAILSTVDFSFKVECPSEFDCAPDAQLSARPDARAGDRLPGARLRQPAPPAAGSAGGRGAGVARAQPRRPGRRHRRGAGLCRRLLELLPGRRRHRSLSRHGAAPRLGAPSRPPARLSDARRAQCAHVGATARGCRFAHAGCAHAAADARQWTVAGAAPDTTELARARAARPVVFETLHAAQLFQVHNELAFYTWGDEGCCLPAGATAATLTGDLTATLQGRCHVLIFVEQRSPLTGYRADADLTRRHAVRLTQITANSDPLGGQFATPPSANPVAVTEIAWMVEDALPFVLDLSMVQVPAADLVAGEEPRQPASIALGNIVLADYGETLPPETLPPVANPRRFRPALAREDVTFAAAFDPAAPASTSVATPSLTTLPAITLASASGTWLPVRDLLNSDRFQTEFVAESDSDGSHLPALWRRPHRTDAAAGRALHGNLPHRRRDGGQHRRRRAGAHRHQ
jgi:hypothetical protein